MFLFYIPENTIKTEVFWCFKMAKNANINQKKVRLFSLIEMHSNI